MTFTPKVPCASGSVLPNGNRVAQGELENGRHWAQWQGEIQKEPKTIEWDAEAAEKAGFEPFYIRMIIEMYTGFRNIDQRLII